MLRDFAKDEMFWQDFILGSKTLAASSLCAEFITEACELKLFVCAPLRVFFFLSSFFFFLLLLF